MDEQGEVSESRFIEAGTVGEVVSMEASSTEDFNVHYGILFKSPDEEIEVSIRESRFEEFLSFEEGI